MAISIDRLQISTWRRRRPRSRSIGAPRRVSATQPLIGCDPAPRSIVRGSGAHPPSRFESTARFASLHCSICIAALLNLHRCTARRETTERRSTVGLVDPIGQFGLQTWPVRARVHCSPIVWTHVNSPPRQHRRGSLRRWLCMLGVVVCGGRRACWSGCWRAVGSTATTRKQHERGLGLAASAPARQASRSNDRPRGSCRSWSRRRGQPPGRVPRVAQAPAARTRHGVLSNERTRLLASGSRQIIASPSGKLSACGMITALCRVCFRGSVHSTRSHVQAPYSADYGLVAAQTGRARMIRSGYEALNHPLHPSCQPSRPARRISARTCFSTPAVSR